MTADRCRALIFSGLCLALLWAACGPASPEWRGRMEERDGSTWVVNPKEPLYPEAALNLEENLVIGEDESDERQILQDIRTLDVDEQGFIYVLDEQAGNIKVYDENGGWLRTMGRKGQGPGEFGLPVMVLITPEREILVHDMGQRSLKFFDTAGTFLRQLSIADKFQFVGPRPLPEGGTVGSYLVPAAEPTAELVLLDSSLQPKATLVSLPVTPPPVLQFFAANSMTGLRWNVTAAGEIVWFDFLKPEYAIHWHDSSGRHLRSIERVYDPIKIAAAEKDRLMKEMFGDRPPPSQWDIRFPDSFPPFSGLSCDDAGRIYVKTHVGWAEEGIHTYDVFDREGRFAAEISLTVPLLVMKKGFLYTIVEDQAGFRTAKRFKMTWTNSF